MILGCCLKSPSVDNPRLAARVPRYSHLSLSKQVVHNVSRFHLQAHILKLESGLWNWNFLCDQDEKLSLFYCKDAHVSALHQTCADLFYNLFRSTKEDSCWSAHVLLLRGYVAVTSLLVTC